MAPRKRTTKATGEVVAAKSPKKSNKNKLEKEPVSGKVKKDLKKSGSRKAETENTAREPTKEENVEEKKSPKKRTMKVRVERNTVQKDVNKKDKKLEINPKSKKGVEKTANEDSPSDEGKKRKLTDDVSDEDNADVKPIKGKKITKKEIPSISSKKDDNKRNAVKVKEEPVDRIVEKEPIDESPAVDVKTNYTREIMQYSQKWVGAHVSISGGLYKAIEKACSLEANALGLFLRSQRRWESPALTQKSIEEFENKIKETNFGCSVNDAASLTNGNDSYFESIKDQILPHGSYLINLGNPDKVKRAKSFSVFLDDLKRCESLSIALYNLHPGSTCGDTSIENSIAFIAENINNAHDETKRVKIIIENMAGQGNIIGSKFEELASIIGLVKNKSRIGVCLDTCHLFAAGYDVRTADAWNKTLDEFDKIVGLKYLSALHLNDSKGPLGCNKDRHECIGKGYIGLECFEFIMRDPRFCNMPLILETPDEKMWFKEIQLLHSFIKPMPKKEEK